MADISMCENNNCPLRKTCYRFIAKVNPYMQSYSDFKFTINDQGKPECDSYWLRR